MELVHTLIVVLYGLAYCVAAPCSKDASKVILIRANGAKEIIRNAEAADLIKSLSIENELEKEDHLDSGFDKDISTENYSHLLLEPEEKDTTSIMITKKMPESNKKKSVFKKSVHHKNVPRQTNSSPEQGIWAWRGKKEATKRHNNKRNWSYFSSKMRHIMKKQHRKPYGDEKQRRENDAYQFSSRRDDGFSNTSGSV